MLIIAHRLSTIRHAQQIVVLDNGRVAEVGTHAELLLRPEGLYSRMWDMQVKGSGATASSSTASFVDILPVVAELSPSDSSASPWDLVTENQDDESSALISGADAAATSNTTGGGEGNGGGKKKGKKNRK